MKTWHKITSLLTLLVIVSYLLIKSYPTLKTAVATPSPTMIAVSITPTATQVTSTPGECHINGVLPDSSCTPGTIDPKVTQSNINQTICLKGYTKTIRPPTSYTNQLKIQQITAYGYTDINLGDYEEDHLISLELGGASADPKNLWPEPGASPNPKDKTENLCHRKVCSGQITLAEAQREIATNWQTACQ
jgi:hypothetical protein